MQQQPQPLREGTASLQLNYWQKQKIYIYLLMRFKSKSEISVKNTEMQGVASRLPL